MPPELKEILRNVLGVDSVSEDDSAATIDAWDSVRHLDLMMAIEEQFGIRFEAEEIPDLSSVRAISQVIEARASGR